MAKSTNNPTHKVYWIRDRGEGRKAAWSELGVGFTNRDGSINLVLGVLPLDGRMQVRLFEPKRGDEKK